MKTSPTLSIKRTTSTATAPPIPLTPDKHNKVFCMRLAEKAGKKQKKKGSEGIHHKADAMTSMTRERL